MRISLSTLLFLRLLDEQAQVAVNTWFSFNAPYRVPACFYNSDTDTFDVRLIWD